MKKNPNNLLFIALLFGLVITFLLNISFGQVAIPIKEVAKSVFGIGEVKDTWNYIILNFRLPKAITAMLVGIGLSISGLLMQTLFRNPLAGPYVLGLSSGSSLGVAFVIMGAAILPPFLANLFLSSLGILLASISGSLLVLSLVFLVSKKLKDTMSILIVGLMFSSFTGAIVSVLTYFSTAEQLQKFTFWSMGNLSNLSWIQIVILSSTVLVGATLSLLSIKSLDAFLLGENYAKSLGINIKKQRNLIFMATGILAGSITAFVGPIAFVGLAVPHISKLVFQTSNHKVLFFATMLLGALIMLFCDTVSQLPGFDFTLPINAITSILGAPVVIWLLVRKRGIS
ncbi:iron ABC transporter permease [Flavobacterium difficile]|uniref:Iron ABC transporter permease n=1 Tax=Flavobacterium difficile TaxID=2709659 RepID=A0ABX0I3H7_9FLAO|nr:iron ABC transporter permease [Flavobacterium difficile]NHM01286.1 iron ABC transporter permease [Flavobacterium difficile]